MIANKFSGLWMQFNRVLYSFKCNQSSETVINWYSTQSLLYLVPLIAPNLTAINVSSTSYNVTWTTIPKDFHNGILLGFRLFFWKHLEGEDSAENVTYGRDVFSVQFPGVRKWTIFCVQVAAFTAVGDGPRSSVDCTRTFEDGNI